jgi:diguanylate cyclase (GGDEF)-like protein
VSQRRGKIAATNSETAAWAKTSSFWRMCRHISVIEHRGVKRALAAIRSETQQRGDASSRRGVGRLGGALYLSASAVIFLTVPLLPGNVNTIRALMVAALAGIAGVVFLLLPWGRWPGTTLVLVPLCAHAMFGLASIFVPLAVPHYMALYVLTYMFMGIALAPRVSVCLAPFTAVLALAGPANRTVNTAIMITLCVVVGETVAHISERDRRNREHLGSLLDSTRLLASAANVAEAAGVIADQIGRLLGCDFITVHLADPEQPGQYSNRDDHEGPLPVNINNEPTGVGAVLRSGQILFVPDAATSTIVARRITEAAGIKSMLYVPLLGAEGPVGALAIGWHRRRDRLDDVDSQILEVLGLDAGRVLQRLARTEQTEAETLTDPLTAIGNRRRWDNSLEVLEPLDVVVIIDVDHMKDINDRRGHQHGDTVLRALAACLSAASRSGDHVCRIGGDEFGVILSHGGDGAVRPYIDRVLTLWDGEGEPASFSTGHAVLEQDVTVVETVRRADEDLYRTKRNRTATN